MTHGWSETQSELELLAESGQPVTMGGGARNSIEQVVREVPQESTCIGSNGNSACAHLEGIRAETHEQRTPSPDESEVIHS